MHGGNIVIIDQFFSVRYETKSANAYFIKNLKFMIQSQRIHVTIFNDHSQFQHLVQLHITN